jgi:hypothetical protein
MEEMDLTENDWNLEEAFAIWTQQHNKDGEGFSTYRLFNIVCFDSLILKVDHLFLFPSLRVYATNSFL